MSDNLHYWYGGGFNNGGGFTELPVQAIPTSKKNSAWIKANMDALERIGLKQLRENSVFKDFYRMVEGKMAFSEITDVIPQLREVEETLDDLKLPTFIKHYDLIGIIVNGLVGEYMLNIDKFNVTNVDEISTTEYERDKQNLVKKYIKEEFDKELNKRLIENGINPDPVSLNIKDPEELQKYIEFLDTKKEELTPPEIETHMNTKWRTKASIWGEHTLESDTERFYMDELDRKNLVDFLLTGRCFRHFRVGYDYYSPENWSPLNTFFSKDMQTEYPQKGEYVGRVHFYTPSQVVNLYADRLTGKQKEELLNQGKAKDGYNTNYGSGGRYGAEKVLEKHFGETHIVPHQNYYDYNFLKSIQEEFGVPVAETTFIGKDGSKNTVPSFLPDRFSGGNNHRHSHLVAQSLRTDMNIRTDLLQVTEAYWVSYDKIGYITFEDDKGIMVQEIVTDELLKDFLKENNISQCKTKTLKEVEENPEINTIVWDYRPVVYKGIKIAGGFGCDIEPIYLDGVPLEFQLKGEGSAVFDVLLPVAGIIDTSLAVKFQPFQIAHNVAMNQAYNLMEKEIGMFFIFDVNFLPSEFKEWGDSEETLLHLRNMVKDVGMFPIDASKQNVRDGGGFNQFAVQNLSFGPMIAEKLQIADSYKQRAFEQVGFTPQRLGNPIKYETAEGVRNSQTASFAQTEIYFSKFSGFKKRALEMHLNVAQYAQKDGKDITVFYTKSDSSKSFLRFTDEHFPLRNLGILPISNSKKRKELENFKSYLLNTNTLGSDEMSLARLFSSDTMVELIEAARAERLRREQRTAEERQYQTNLIQQQAELAKQEKLEEWERTELSKQRDRDNRIDIERIEALGRAADNNTDTTNLDFINRTADLALKTDKLVSDRELAKQKLAVERDKNNKKANLDLEKLKLEVLKTKAQMERTKTDKYIAEINKN